MDIQNLLTNLQKTGMTQIEIASFVGCSQSAISDIANGKIGKSRPSYKIVDGLIRLAKNKGVRINVEKANSRRSVNPKS